MTYADTQTVDWDTFAHAEPTRRAAERIDAEYLAGHVEDFLAELRATGRDDVRARVDVFETQWRIWRRHRAAEHLERTGGAA